MKTVLFALVLGLVATNFANACSRSQNNSGDQWEDASSSEPQPFAPGCVGGSDEFFTDDVAADETDDVSGWEEESLDEAFEAEFGEESSDAELEQITSPWLLESDATADYSFNSTFEDDENEHADRPVEVSGSFLV